MTPPVSASGASCPDVLDPRAADPESRAHLRAWLALHAALHLQPEKAVELLERTGDPAAALRAAGRYSLPLPSAVPGEGARLDQRIETLARLGVRALPWLSRLYPEPLRGLPDAAPLLFVRGEPGVLLGRAVAIVGARALTVYGLDVAREIASSLAAAGLVVVSGLARGIDSAAHQAALEAGGLTVAFLACGPDRVYPTEHASLAREIAASGAVVTEMPPGTPPLPGYFPLRNRLISGLAEMVIVVEGRLRSGSLVTARRALDQGRDVMAVPGPIGSPTSRGPNRLLRDGASPVTEIADVFRELGVPSPEREAAGRRGHPLEGGSVLASLAREPATRDELAAHLGLAPGQLALELMELELAGRIASDRDGRLHVRRRP